MDPTKVAAITSWPEPHNVRDVQSFLGFCNFYCHFIDAYSKISHPLTNLCCKMVPWHFGEQENTAFLHMKETFTSVPVLCHWMPNMLMTLETDASDHAIATILSVTTPDHRVRPVTFHSCSLHDAEKNYNIHNKNC